MSVLNQVANAAPEDVEKVRREGRIKTRPAFDLYVGEAIRHIPIPKAVVTGRFAENSLVFVMGEPGVGKTFWAVSFGVAVAAGQERWMGANIHNDLRGSTVVYALAEGAGMFQVRVVGALQQIGLHQIPDSFIFTKQSLKLDDLATVERFIHDTAPHKPRVVVVDTYQRHGGPETEVEKVNAAIAHLTLIKEELGCMVTGIHHLPKDGRQTPRGHGAIDGSIDTAVYLNRDDEGIITARFEQRDMEGSAFCAQTKVVPVEGYVDDNGLLRNTCVLELCDPKKTQRVVQKSKKADELTKAIIAAVTLTPGLNQTELCKAVGGNKNAAVAEINRLVGTGHLRKTQSVGRKGQTVNHFDLGVVPF